MSLWGATDSDESKPKNLTTAEKLEVSASAKGWIRDCLLYTSPSPRDLSTSRMPSSA